MLRNLKLTAIGATAALALASASAFAQQAMNPSPQPDAPMNHQMMKEGGGMGMMGMMQDPEMRRQMSAMMSNCNRMMERMGGGMPAGAPRS